MLPDPNPNPNLTPNPEPDLPRDGEVARVLPDPNPNPNLTPNPEPDLPRDGEVARVLPAREHLLPRGLGCRVSGAGCRLGQGLSAFLGMFN